jgi:hypothetical protein
MRTLICIAVILFLLSGFEITVCGWTFRYDPWWWTRK